MLQHLKARISVGFGADFFRDSLEYRQHLSVFLFSQQINLQI